MSSFLNTIMHAVMVFFVGYVFAFIFPKKIIPQRVVDGAITAKQADISTKIARIGGFALMILAAGYFVYWSLIGPL